jgi:hypothetical protein
MESEHSLSHEVQTTSKMSYVYLLVLAASLAGNVYLAQSRASLKRILSTTASIAKSQADGKIGSIVDHLSVKDASGVNSTLSLRGDKKTVIYIFSPTCHWCAANYSSIRALAEQRGKEYSFIGLSVTSDASALGPYLQTHPYPFPSYTERFPADLAALGFSGTPETIVIDEGGKIEQHWRGAYGKATGTSVQQFFAVSLPDLSKQFDF